MPPRSNEVVPLAIVDVRTRAELVTENADRDFRQSLAAKSLIQRLQPELRGDPEHAVEFDEQVLISRQLLLEVSRDVAQALELIALSVDAVCKRSAFVEQLLRELRACHALQVTRPRGHIV